MCLSDHSDGQQRAKHENICDQREARVISMNELSVVCVDHRENRAHSVLLASLASYLAVC